MKLPSRRAFLASTAGAGLHSLRGAAKDRPPNIVVILADDQGWGDLSVHGNTNLSHAAHRLAGPRRGAVRALLRLPGLLADAGRVPHRPLPSARRRPRASPPAASGSNLDEKTIADAFKAAGYATGAFGKWHNGSQYPYHPNAPRLRRVLRLHLRPLGRLLRPAAGPQRPARPRQRLHHRRPDRPRARVHRAEHATGRSSATCRSTRRTRRCRCRTGTATSSSTPT